jgi:hypothetical protein
MGLLVLQRRSSDKDRKPDIPCLLSISVGAGQDSYSPHNGRSQCEFIGTRHPVRTPSTSRSQLSSNLLSLTSKSCLSSFPQKKAQEARVLPVDQSGASSCSCLGISHPLGTASSPPSIIVICTASIGPILVLVSPHDLFFLFFHFFLPLPR